MHQAAAGSNEPQTILQRKDAGDTGGYNFAHAVTHYDVGLNAPGAPQFGQRIFDGKEGGLCIGGLVEEGRRRPALLLTRKDHGE